jgi:hypothetical protein
MFLVLESGSYSVQKKHNDKNKLKMDGKVTFHGNPIDAWRNNNYNQNDQKYYRYLAEDDELNFPNKVQIMTSTVRELGHYRGGVCTLSVTVAVRYVTVAVCYFTDSVRYQKPDMG